MRWIQSMVFVVYLSGNIFAQVDSKAGDSLVLFAELQFLSPDERQSFACVDSSHDTGFLRMALNARTSDPGQVNSMFSSQYRDLISRIESGRFLSLNAEKKVKLIYSKVHEILLKKYSLYCTFDQLFFDGTYNCVTASLLYGILLSQYNIPFEIRETPEHVFLVAKPGSKSTLMESTSPTQGYVSYNEVFRDRFIEYLREMKRITAEDILSQGKDSVFNKFFFAQNSITLKQLVGIQYYNNGVSLMQLNDFVKAFEQLQKSYFLYPTEKTRFLMQSTLAVLLMNASYFEEDDWKYFIYISRHKSSILTNEAIKNEFGRLTQKILVDKSQVRKYQQAYEYIIDGIADSSLKMDITFLYNFETGRYYLTNERIREAFPFIEEAFKLRQENYEVQNLFVTIFIAMLGELPDDEALATLERYYTEFEKLHKDKRITGMMTGIYLFRASILYENEQWNDGDVYLQKFEEMMDQYPEITGLSYQIENVYTRVAAHYFKMNRLKKSKEYLSRGLKYFPESYRLTHALETVN